jgi:hypothetical protein
MQVAGNRTYSRCREKGNIVNDETHGTLRSLPCELERIAAHVCVAQHDTGGLFRGARLAYSDYRVFRGRVGGLRREDKET